MMDDTTLYRRLVERYMNGSISRRSFLAVLGAAAATYGVGGGPMRFLMREAHAAGRIRYDGFGGTVDKAVGEHALDPFTKRTGIEVERGSYGGMDEFLSKLQASAPGQYNVFLCTDQFNYKRFSDLGYAAELDEKKIPNLANCMPTAVEIFRKLGNGKPAAVPYVYSVGVWSYNTKHVDDAYVAKAGLDALIDPKWKGKLAGDLNWATRIWIAAQQSGQDPNGIKDMNAVWDKIRQSKELVLKYYTSGAEQINLMANEDAWIADTWAGRMAVLARQGHPIKTVVPPQGRTYVGNMYVIKGSPMDAAHELLNTMLEPAVAIAVGQSMAYPPAIDPTRFKMPEDITSLAGFDPTGTLSTVLIQDPVYWNKNALEWQKQFQRVVSR